MKVSMITSSPRKEGTREAIQKTDYPQRAYQIGKNL